MIANVTQLHVKGSLNTLEGLSHWFPENKNKKTKKKIK
jgi:hypothetical protein